MIAWLKKLFGLRKPVPNKWHMILRDGEKRVHLGIFHGPQNQAIECARAQMMAWFWKNRGNGGFVFVGNYGVEPFYEGDPE